MNAPLRVLIFGYGNPGRGDDALGPEVIQRLDALLASQDFPSGLEVTLLTDFQLQVEHALDLRDQDLCLFIDAHLTAAPPFVFERVSADPNPSFSTHWVSPGTLLKVYQDHYGSPPPTYVLGIRGELFELGEPLSATAMLHMEAALAYIRTLLEDPRRILVDG